MTTALSPSTRRGSLLIIVAGLAALVASLVLAFLARSRMSAEGSLSTIRAAQARMMLQAGCSYVLEGSRIGWDLVGTSAHEEAYGWVDVRDGQVGPKTLDYDGDGDFDPLWRATLVEDGDGDGAVDRPAWPAIGGVARCPMEVLRRPPYAISLAAAPNPIISDPLHPHFGLPLLRNPDPQPAYPGMTWTEFRDGDPEVTEASRNLSWFRIHRDGPATFVITCGAGASKGFRDWDEVVGAGATGQFAGDRELFEKEILGNEVRLWYRIEWSPAVNPGADVSGPADVAQWPVLASINNNRSNAPYTTRKNQGGTIQWIQRLRHPPVDW